MSEKDNETKVTQAAPIELVEKKQPKIKVEPPIPSQDKSESKPAEPTSGYAELMAISSEEGVLAALKPQPGEADPIVELSEAGEKPKLPCWLTTICFVALLTMATQIKLPVPESIANALHFPALANGILALADIGFLAAAIAVAVYMIISKATIRLHMAVPLAVLGIALANVFSRPGLDGAIEIAQLAEQLLGGVVLFAFMTRYMPRTTLAAVTTAIAINLAVAIFQYITAGFWLTLAPADVNALHWGFGKAMTGLFRSKMAFSFFLAAAATWAAPQWFNCKRACDVICGVKCFVAFLGLAAIFFFIPNGMMKVIAIVALIASTAVVSTRAALSTVSAAALAIFITCFIPDNAPRQAFLNSISPLKGENYVANASVLFNQSKPVIRDEAFEEAHELKTCYYDTIAAFRMGAKLPWHGVGSGKYQTNIRRCYQPDLPSPPGVNDIETDTQSGWGILAATVGFPATMLMLFAFAIAIGANIKRSRESNLAAGAAISLVVLSLGMLISDPLTRGLGWFVALALASSKLPYRNEYAYREFSIWKIIMIAIPIGALIVLVAARPAIEDPLANAPAASAEHTTKAVVRCTDSDCNPEQAAAIVDAEPEPADDKPFNPSDNELFMVLNAARATQVSVPMTKEKDDEVPEGVILEIKDGTGVPPEGKNPDLEYGGAVFEFETAEDFNAEIWLNVVWDGSCGNTIDIKLDDEKRSVTVGNDGTYNVWHWMKSPKSYRLRAGKHKLYVLNREDGIKLSQVFITNDKNTVPSGFEEE